MTDSFSSKFCSLIQNNIGDGLNFITCQHTLETKLDDNGKSVVFSSTRSRFPRCV